MIPVKMVSKLTRRQPNVYPCQNFQRCTMRLGRLVAPHAYILALSLGLITNDDVL